MFYNLRFSLGLSTFRETKNDYIEFLGLSN